MNHKDDGLKIFSNDNYSYILNKYNENEHMEIWDKFIENSVNGTIFHTRMFLNYHDRHKFTDTSILIYKNGTLICVLPCCKTDDKYFSHKGATYGGPVFIKEIFNIKELTFIMNIIFIYYDNKIEFRIANNIYFKDNIDILLYILSVNTKLNLELSWYNNTAESFIENIKNKWNKKLLLRIIKNNEYICQIYEDEDDYVSFYNILRKNLQTKYNISPTHTLNEFLLLKQNINDKMKLYLVKDNNSNIYSGICVIKASKNCWYTMYISKNTDIKINNQSVLFIIYTIHQYAKKENIKYIDFGVSTENNGSILNMSLSYYKEYSFSGKSCNRYLFLL